MPLNRQASCSPHAIAPLPVNALVILSMSLNIDPNAFIPRAVNTGEVSSASAIAASALSE